MLKAVEQATQGCSLNMQCLWGRSFPDWNMIGNNFLEDPTLKLAGGGLVSTANDFLKSVYLSISVFNVYT